jgi:DNA-binding transcriptional regulator YiaG
MVNTAPPDTARSNLAERVRASRLPAPADRARIRRTARATLRDFAAELDVSAATVWRWEQGAEPRLDHAIAYRGLLDEIQAATGTTRGEGVSP